MSYCMHCGHELPENAAYCPLCDHPTPATLASRAAEKTGSSKMVWVLVGVGCLVFAIASMGIIAAILIPNFLDALQKAKQKRTVADLRAVNTAIISYATDHEKLPEGRTYEQVVAELVPEYLPSLMTVDGWKRPFRYECWSQVGVAPGCDTYRIASPGRDGVFEHESLAEYEHEVFPRQDYDRDLVVGDGVAIQYPGPG